MLDSVDCLGQRARTARRKRDLQDATVAGGDARLTMYYTAVGEGGHEMDVGKRGRKDAATDGKDFAADAHGFREVARNMRKCGQEQIPEIVADQAATCLEAVLKKAAEKGFILGECDHAVANIARRENTIFAAQTSGTPPVIGDSNNSGEIDDGAFRGGMTFMSAKDMFLEASQKSGEPCAATECDHTVTLDDTIRICDFSPQSSVSFSDKIRG